MDRNRQFFTTAERWDNLELRAKTTYDSEMFKLRFALIDEYGTGRDVLDLCCGTGSYLAPRLDSFRRAIGVDFSPTMLEGFRARLGDRTPPHLLLVEADATSLPLATASVEFVFSFASLYYVPQVGAAIRETARVLRHGGYAALELGNLHSLNTIVCESHYRRNGWAKPFHVSYGSMNRYIREAGLAIVNWRAFQLLPMYGAPPRLRYLEPLLSPYWKRLLSVRLGHPMLDEWISSSWPLRYLAFRHLVIVRKP